MTRPGEDLIGRQLSHYRIVRQLGRGGMGEVYLAEDLKLKRQVALKVLPPEFAENERRRSRFRREAESIARLNHPNIVTVYSTEEADGIYFITMEMVEGQSFESAVPPDGFNLDKFLALAVQISDALAAAHESGVIHRDLKPANVMLTPRGRVKILDFGLAKVGGDPQSDADTELATMTATVDGALVGTVPYMSPEQIGGRPADERSDIFSVGLLFFEMLSGRRAFHGDSAIEQAAAILHEDPPSVTDVREGLPRQLGRILTSCLEKDIETRLQTAKDLRNQLSALRTEVETSRISAVIERTDTAAPKRGRRLPRAAVAAVAAVAVTALLAVGWLVLRPRGEPAAPIGAPASADSLAVLYFRNLSGDPESDWLSRGLTEMLVTDLSQLPELKLLGTEKLHSILKELGVLEAETLDAETVRELAERAEVDNVLSGSFARVGDELRISARLQDAATGEILDSSTVSAAGEPRVFELIDQLSRELRTNLKLRAVAGAESDRPVEQVLTSSVEAFRYYSEGLRLHLESKDREAIPLFEAAIEADPGFSMALVRLATVSSNLGYRERARRYTQRALEGADRLPPRYRHYVEAQYYGSEWETYGQAIEAYRRAIEADPQRKSARNLLGMHLMNLERYPEAIEQYETLRRMNDPFAFTHYPLALAHTAEGRWQDGVEVLESFVESYPDNWLGHWALGWQLLLAGRLQESDAALTRAGALHRDEFYLPWARRLLALAKEDFAAADRVADDWVSKSDPLLQYRGHYARALNLLFRGQAHDALAALEQARAVVEPGADRAAAHNVAAEIWLALDEPERALEETVAARLEGDRRWPERKAIYQAALAEGMLGNIAQADQLMLELERRHAVYPNLPEERQLALLEARLARLHGDSEGALALLGSAAALLPPRGVAWHTYSTPDHPAIWLELGRAELAGGDAAAAVEWLLKLVEGESERIDAPIAYVSSLFFLGRAHAELGRPAEAKSYFARFVELWNDGDLHRDWVEEAEAFLSSGA